MNNRRERAEHPGLRPIDDSALTRESWKIFQIMAEFVEGFERLAHIKPSVSIFGSARFPPGHRYYELARPLRASSRTPGSPWSVAVGRGSWRRPTRARSADVRRASG